MSHGLVDHGGAEVTVLCTRPGARTVVEQDGCVRVVRVGSFGRVARASLSPTLPFWLRRIRPDIAHFHCPDPTAEISCLLADPGCPLVVTYHGETTRFLALNRLYQWPLRAFLRRADRILVSTPALIENTVNLPRLRHKCEVVPSGFSEDRLRETERVLQVERRLRATHARPLLLFVGRLRGYKGIPVLLDAMKTLPGTLLLVGTGELETQIREKVRTEGLERRVILEGDVADEDLPGYYRAADVFVLPSVNQGETFGIAMAEALYLGTPAVSTRLGTGTSYVNLDGVTGIETTPGDARDLARGIRWILEHPDESRRMSEAAHRHASQFGVGAMVGRTLEIYRRLLEDRAAGAGGRR